jgi:hypothetical protein
MGHSCRFDHAQLTSGLPATPDILAVRQHVAKVPKTELSPDANEVRSRPDNARETPRFRKLFDSLTFRYPGDAHALIEALAAGEVNRVVARCAGLKAP